MASPFQSRRMQDSAPRDQLIASSVVLILSCAMALRYLLRKIKHGRHSSVPWQDVMQEITFADYAGDTFHVRVATSALIDRRWKRCVQILKLLRRQRQRQRDGVFLHMAH
jgi:hypothetical protein